MEKKRIWKEQELQEHLHSAIRHLLLLKCSYTLPHQQGYSSLTKTAGLGVERTSRLGDWRMTDRFGLEGTLKDPPVQLPAMARDIFH